MGVLIETRWKYDKLAILGLYFVAYVYHSESTETLPMW